MKKKKLGLEDLGGFVFSTNEDFEFDTEESQETLPPEEQYLEAHFSNKGRGGKTVTVVKGFEGTDEDLKALGKLLKKKCNALRCCTSGRHVIFKSRTSKIVNI